MGKELKPIEQEFCDKWMLKGSKKDALQYFKKGDWIKSYSEDEAKGNISTWIIEALEVHYGVNQKDMSVNLLRNISETVYEQFKYFTKDDFKHAYEFFRPFQKEGQYRQKPTKKDLIYPLNKWKNKKNEIHNEFTKFKSKDEEDVKYKQEKDNFYRYSVKLYIESQKGLEWLGTRFNANVIVSELIKHFKEDEINQFKKESEEEVTMLKKRRSEVSTRHLLNDENLHGLAIDPNFIGLTPERVLANIIVKESIKRGYNLY